jgi:hypothetical protein
VANSIGEPAADAEAPERGDASGQRLRPASLGGLLAGLASQAVVLTAVLFYFGWARERATFA